MCVSEISQAVTLGNHKHSQEDMRLRGSGGHKTCPGASKNLNASKNLKPPRT